MFTLGSNWSVSSVNYNHFCSQTWEQESLVPGKENTLNSTRDSSLWPWATGFMFKDDLKTERLHLLRTPFWIKDSTALVPTVLHEMVELGDGWDVRPLQFLMDYYRIYDRVFTVVENTIWLDSHIQDCEEIFHRYLQIPIQSYVTYV